MRAARIGVAILHGIGTQREDFADAFVARLSQALQSRGIEAGSFAFRPIFWAEVLAPAERELLGRLSGAGPLDWRDLRMFVVESLADAIAYRRGHPKSWDAYHAIHWEVFRGLAALRDELGRPNAPLAAVGHSLGSVIFSDHVWDEQKGEGFGRDPFTRCETLAGLITFGSNIPLFTLGLPEVRCIKFPPDGSCLPAGVRGAARWRNYYDRDDVLGYPLRALSESYSKAVEQDIELDAGNLLTSWNPLSHNGYWTNARFIDAVAEQLEALYLVSEPGQR